MTDLFLCWCPRAIEDHHNGECPTRTEWLEVDDSSLHDLDDVAAAYGVNLG